MENFIFFTVLLFVNKLNKRGSLIDAFSKLLKLNKHPGLLLKDLSYLLIKNLLSISILREMILRK